MCFIIMQFIIASDTIVAQRKHSNKMQQLIHSERVKKQQRHMMFAVFCL